MNQCVGLSDSPSNGGFFSGYAKAIAEIPPSLLNGDCIIHYSDGIADKMHSMIMTEIPVDHMKEMNMVIASFWTSEAELMG